MPVTFKLESNPMNYKQLEARHFNWRLNLSNSDFWSLESTRLHFNLLYTYADAGVNPLHICGRILVFHCNWVIGIDNFRWLHLDEFFWCHIAGRLENCFRNSVSNKYYILLCSSSICRMDQSNEIHKLKMIYEQLVFKLEPIRWQLTSNNWVS